MSLESDGVEYEMLESAVESVSQVPGLILEIGTRKGGSMEKIINSLMKSGQAGRNVISVDPYGHIPYNSGKQYGITRFDYTNEMKKEAMAALFELVKNKPVNFVPFCLTDQVFMWLFSDGVPIYDNMERCINLYAFAFLDGPHDTASVLSEIKFLSERMVKGAAIIIDNIDFFDLSYVITAAKMDGFEVVKKGEHKIWICKH